MARFSKNAFLDRLQTNLNKAIEKYGDGLSHPKVDLIGSKAEYSYVFDYISYHTSAALLHSYNATGKFTKADVVSDMLFRSNKIQSEWKFDLQGGYSQLKGRLGTIDAKCACRNEILWFCDDSA